jgi:hypothetical protein
MIIIDHYHFEISLSIFNMYLVNSILFKFWLLGSSFLLNLKQNIQNIYLLNHLVKQNIINVYYYIIWWLPNQSFCPNFQSLKWSFVNFKLFKSLELTKYMIFFMCPSYNNIVCNFICTMIIFEKNSNKRSYHFYISKFEIITPKSSIFNLRWTYLIEYESN